MNRVAKGLYVLSSGKDEMVNPSSPPVHTSTKVYAQRCCQEISCQLQSMPTLLDSLSDRSALQTGPKVCHMHL